ncbi:MAG: hypothetical protein DI544_12550 [Sphingomonas taxi]|uniref:Uncharacterized protein n=1 Tax=Sphingomonas taxi TaxID=1549858 RepID=A0A2W5QMF4_9SPHN|nr:MAG: hypothetical protein DI544_12550 [Sphingomonas taxi]
MLLNIAAVGGTMAAAFLKSLKADGAKIKALAGAEAQKLATSIATIGELLKDGDIDQEEAEALIEVQQAATVAVFASLEGIGRVAARRATSAGLGSVTALVDGVIGIPLLGSLTQVAHVEAG